MTTETAERPIDAWFARYSADHQNPTNQAIHYVAVPTILWTVTALLWCVPVPGTLFGPGAWAAFSMFLMWMFYFRHSRNLAMGMLLLFVAMSWGTRWLHLQMGSAGLAWLALAVFVVAWIGQFIGHKIEGRKPSFLTDLTYLLIGPIWVLNKLYRKLGWKY